MDTRNGPEFVAPRRRASVAIVALVCVLALLTGALVWLADATRERIAINQQTGVASALSALLAPDIYDNEPLEDTIEVAAPDFLGTARPVTVYRVRKNGRESVHLDVSGEHLLGDPGPAVPVLAAGNHHRLETAVERDTELP